MTGMKRLFLLSSLLLPLLCHQFFATGAPARTDWSTIDLDTIDKEWESGDDADILATPDDELYQLLEKKRKEAFDRLESLMSDTSDARVDEKAVPRAVLDAQRAGKSVMIFATLREDEAPEDNESWSWDSMAKVCDEWSHLLSYALVEISCYPIEPTERDSNASILITTPRGWNGEDIWRFLVEHPHPTTIASEVKWNDRTTKLQRSLID